MESDASAPLLSLTGTVEDILLSFVSAGEGGVQAVLNLRKVCSTTKMWVDSLRPHLAKRIFSSRQAKVELSAERLEEFLAAPPPSGVTSLRLTQTDNLSDHRFPPEKEELWSRFVSFWSPKLNSLKVDVVFLPLNLKLGQLLSCESLRVLLCRSIKHIDGRSTELPESLFRFAVLHVGRLEMEVSQKQEFYARLSTQSNLKNLVLKSIDKRADLTGILDLIESKKATEDFLLSIKLDPDKLSAGEADVDGLNLLYVRLATLVAKCSFDVRLRGLSDDEILWVICDQLSEEICREFLESVVGMTYFFLPAGMSGFDPTAADFPNLETYRLNVFPENCEPMETLDASAFPARLKELQVVAQFPPPASLPSTLTHLDIQNYSSPVNKLLNVLVSLAEECPSLKNLKMKWTCYVDCYETESDPSYGFRSFATSTGLKGLKSLDFCAELRGESEAAVVRMILLHGFKLPQLTLWDLKVSFNKRFRVVDHNILIALNCGPISNSLLNLNIDHRYVAEDAHPLLAILKSTAAENRRNRMETHGKERKNQFNR